MCHIWNNHQDDRSLQQSDKKSYETIMIQKLFFAIHNFAIQWCIAEYITMLVHIMKYHGLFSTEAVEECEDQYIEWGKEDSTR